MENSVVTRILFQSFDLGILNNFSLFETFIKNNEKIIMEAKGKNEHGECPFKNFCYKNGKKFIIEQIISVEPYHTRFPKLKRIVNNFPFLLKLVPTNIYNKFYSFCWDNLGCPYQSYLIPQNLEKIKFVYEHLSDEKSEKTYLAALMTRITHNFSYINHVQETLPVYFIEGFSNLKDQSFVDCGAFTGDTFEDYIKYNSMPKRYYFYEMDCFRIKKIEQTVKKYNATDCAKIRPYGVSDTSGKKTFTEKGMGSFIDESKTNNSSNSVQITSLDEDIFEPVTFIKMDIEGFEIPALNGAKRIIKEYKPKLAISAYHKISDLWEIPYLVISSFPEYKDFYFRQHKKNAIDDAVFYAK